MNSKSMIRCAAVLALLAFLPALAWAQPGATDRRMDDGTNDEVDTAPGPPLHDWSALQVPGLERGATLGTLWADPDAGFYVWATRSTVVPAVSPRGPRVMDPDHPFPGPGEGNPPVTAVTHSTLLRYDGSNWSVALDLPGESGASVLGVEPNRVYAATTMDDGGVGLYRYTGSKWRREVLPADVVGPAGALAGDLTRMFLRAGDAILMSNGRRWTVAYRNPQLVPGNEVVFLNRNQVVAPGRHGQAMWNGTGWSWQPATCNADMNGAWGGRDATGVLHLFATGSDHQCSGTCMFQFEEEGQGTLCGGYQHRMKVPADGGPMTGYGIDVWGSGVHDVYAIATNHGCGCLFRFNGVAWQRLVPIDDMTVPSGLFGTPRGDLWIALQDGRVLHGVRKVPLGAVGKPAIAAPTGARAGGNPLSIRRAAPGTHVIDFTLPVGGAVSVEVYDVAGRRVATVDRSYRTAGAHSVLWVARGVARGIYFCRVRAPGLAWSGRIVVDR